MGPESLSDTRAKRTGVRRVNNVPMYLLGGVLACFVLVMGLVAAGRAARQNATAPDARTRVKSDSAALFAQDIVGGRRGGLVEPASPARGASTSSLPTSLQAARPPDPDAPRLPAPTAGGHDRPSDPRLDEEAQRIQIAKLRLFDEAVRARSTVSLDGARGRGSAPGGLSALSGLLGSPGTPRTREEMIDRIDALRQRVTADPGAAYQARLARFRAAGEEGASVMHDADPASPLLPASPAGGRKSLTQFEQPGQGDRWRLNSQPEAPPTPYTLRAGFVLPATLISGINSELPGQILAQVAQDVDDTPTGQHLLIPQGSRLVGAYSSDVAYGQARVLVAWQRIVFPDGKAMDIGAMPGADGAGLAGFHDRVDNHYGRLFATALLMSGVTAGAAYSQGQPQNPLAPPTAGAALSEALGQQLGQVTAQLIAKNMNIAPTLEIRPGYRFNVVVTKDMVFSRPYRSFAD